MAAFLAAVILMTMSVCQGAFAGETAGIDTARPVSLTIDLEAESKKATISIYKVGEWNGAEGAYALSQEFTGSGADIGDRTATGVLSAAQTLEQFIKNNQIGALSTQATASGKIQFTGLSSGLYLVCQFKASGDNVTVSPYLTTLPVLNEETNTWVYDVTTGMKPQQTQRYGDLEIFKDLTEYNASLKDALFVFQVEGTRNGEQVYSDVVSIKFNQAGKKSVLVKHLPAGTKVTVKEVYAGGSYSNTSGDTQETVIVAEGVTDNPASVSFTNTYNGKLIPGTGIVNHFENKDGEWSWEQQTDEPAIAN